MVKRRFALSSIMGVVVLMALAAGQTTIEAAENTARAERPLLVPHTKFVFKIEGKSGTYSSEFLKNERGVLIFRRVKRSGKIETYRTTEDLASISFIREDGVVRKAFRPHSGFLSFPLYVGKKWKMRYTVSRENEWKYSRERNCRVVGYKNITVKAGTFPSFIIKCENQRENRTWPAYEQYAYAPGVGQVTHYASAEFDYTYQLVKIIPPPQQTTPK